MAFAKTTKTINKKKIKPNKGQYFGFTINKYS